MAEKKTIIRVSLFTITKLKLEVSWDESVDGAMIHSAEREIIQPTISGRDIMEHMTGDDSIFIDELTAKALGIEL